MARPVATGVRAGGADASRHRRLRFSRGFGSSFITSLVFGPEAGVADALRQRLNRRFCLARLILNQPYQKIHSLRQSRQRNRTQKYTHKPRILALLMALKKCFQRSRKMRSSQRKSRFRCRTILRLQKTRHKRNRIFALNRQQRLKTHCQHLLRLLNWRSQCA